MIFSWCRVEWSKKSTSVFANLCTQKNLNQSKSEKNSEWQQPKDGSHCIDISISDNLDLKKKKSIALPSEVDG